VGDRRMFRRALGATLLVATVAAGAPSAPVAGAIAPDACALPVEPPAPGGVWELWTWVGGQNPEPNRWGQPTNWLPPAETGNEFGFPGARHDTDEEKDDDFVCIPAGLPEAWLGTPSTTGHSAQVGVLHNAGTVRVYTGSKLELRAEPAVATSFSDQMELRGTLMGKGVLEVGGRLHWRSTGAGASAMQTRENQSTIAVPQPSAPGRVVVLPAATLDLDGIPGGERRGVNLDDAFIIENRGRTLIRNQNYIAADEGTTFHNTATGTLIFRGSSQYADGHNHPDLQPSLLRNDGKVRKDGGGLAIVGGRYERGPSGQAQVRAGELSVYRRTAEIATATLDPSTADVVLATGGCDGALGACNKVGLTTGRPELAQLRRPFGTAKSTVEIEHLPLRAGSPVRPIRLKVAKPATVKQPMRFTIRVHESTRPTKNDGTLKPKGTIVVSHRADGETKTVVNCAPGVLKRDKRCVAARQGRSASGDLTLVIRTVENGRWRIR
jgi:hypothetical protein